jgi:phage FluMu protein Com
MTQLTLFELDCIRCLDCGAVLRDLSEMRTRCPQSKDIHRVDKREYFSLYNRTPNKLAGMAIDRRNGRHQTT